MFNQAIRKIVQKSTSIFLYPHPSIQNLLIYKESSGNALNVCGYKNCIGGWDVCELWGFHVDGGSLVNTKSLLVSFSDRNLSIVRRHRYCHRRRWCCKLFTFHSFSKIHVCLLIRYVFQLNDVAQGISCFHTQIVWFFNTRYSVCFLGVLGQFS